MYELIRRITEAIASKSAAFRGRFRVRWRKLAFTAALLVGFFILASLTGMEVTSRPQFCGSCHNMKPYYESWKTSSHNTVACVECHIPPGVTSEFRKKYEALSMVTSYFTGTYGTNPWTEIDDASCLRCHERRLLAGKEVFHNVLFNHTPHLSELRRGKKLRCTSCHSQIVQGSHIAVTASTCFLCHFKGQQLNEGTGKCTLCHEIPDKVITKANLSFDHGDVKRFNMQCFSCHSQVVQGQGEVPKERCYSCHGDQKRLQRFSETEFLHQKHVTDHKIECLHCHNEIQHKTALALEPVSTSCGACHRDGHSAARDLYAGIGGKGVPPMPSTMYQAGINCAGCHVLPIDTGETAAFKPTDVNCMSCHGPRYSKVLGRWKALVSERLERVKGELSNTRSRFALKPHQEGPLSDAWANVELVERGGGTHNVEYTLALLDASHEMINKAREQSGLPSLPKQWESAPFQSTCFRCHRGIENQNGAFFGIGFRHNPHIKQGFECATCHRPHEERPASEVVRFGREGCANCHHARETQNASSCMICHSDVRTHKVKFKDKLFDHSMHLDMGKKCAECHLAGNAIKRGPNMTVCAACHPDGFK